jgi:type IV pilus assembly protein PilC
MSADVVTDRNVKSKIKSCTDKVINGTSFSVALLELKMFTGLYARMVQTGEKTGRLDEVMDQLSVRLNEDVDKSLSDIVAFIEPTLVIFLSVIIGSILLSIMLPLIEVMMQIG